MKNISFDIIISLSAQKSFLRHATKPSQHAALRGKEAIMELNLK